MARMCILRRCRKSSSWPIQRPASTDIAQPRWLAATRCGCATSLSTHTTTQRRRSSPSTRPSTLGRRAASSAPASCQAFQTSSRTWRTASAMSPLATRIAWQTLRNATRRRCRRSTGTSRTSTRSCRRGVPSRRLGTVPLFTPATRTVRRSRRHGTRSRWVACRCRRPSPSGGTATQIRLRSTAMVLACSTLRALISAIRHAEKVNKILRSCSHSLSDDARLHTASGFLSSACALQF
mmetsp:Transcript_32493/g.107082  ORF Transcript_32493/g.107082 Transcript_32493/m.107082 type:complete len:237 (+) Transcript_32493:799-1509(+)